MTVAEFITQVLDDLGESSGGFWSRADVRVAASDIQMEITKECRNLMVTLPTMTINASDASLDLGIDYLEVYSAYYVLSSGEQKPVRIYQEEDVIDYDSRWKTREGSTLRALITDVSDEGAVMPYPILDADTDVIIRAIKIADEITTERDTDISIPETDIPALKNGVKALLYDLDRDGKNNKKALYYWNLYERGKAKIIDRVSNKREGTFRMVRDRAVGGIRTRPYFEWEV